MLETNPRKKICDYLNSLPQSCFEVSPPNSNPGKPDVTGCLQGRYVAVEVKVPDHVGIDGKKKRGKAPTRAQFYTLRQLEKAGALCFVAKSVEDLQEFLSRQILVNIPGVNL